MAREVALVRQMDLMDCAPACLMMIGQFHGIRLDLNKARQLCDKGNRGVSLYGINRAAETLGFNTSALKMPSGLFLREAQLPCIVHWRADHFVVVHRISRRHVFVADPAVGHLKLTYKDFDDFWSGPKKYGVALFLWPGKEFNGLEGAPTTRSGGLSRLFGQLRRFKSLLAQLGLGAVVASLLNLIAPFLTQALVDHGIGNRDIGFIYLILAAQVVVFLSRTASEFIRGWILVHIGARVNISVVADFLAKLTRLPLSYFGRRNLGDVLQRIADTKKIEEFLTSHTVNIAFSTLTMVVFSIILVLYSTTIFLIFVAGSALSVFWVTRFLNRRKVLDYKNFSQMTINQNAILEMVYGMPEIRMNQSEAYYRWRWLAIQGKTFKIRLKTLAIEQYQQAGNLFVNEGKNILITFVAAQQVMIGQMTLGMMMAVSYILGQMNAPIEQLLNFVRLAQDAKIGMERLDEIQQMRDETPTHSALIEKVPIGDIRFEGASFKYGIHDKAFVLKDLDLVIARNTVTAIVGASGSGKTTVLRVLLVFYGLNEGRITIGGSNIDSLCPDAWRKCCGVVMQDGYIFNDSFSRNICLGSDTVDMDRLIHAAKLANVHEEIERLPQGYETKIGQEGIELSGGQRQRVLIARAIYKDPSYLFFDEATSALDAINERKIHQNLQSFFVGRTTLIIAHRLSTVKQADSIVVLDQGRIVEVGAHEELVGAKGYYFKLVKNQLELGA